MLRVPLNDADARGKLGGCESKQTSAGLCWQTKPHPFNPRSKGQIRQRAKVAKLARMWATLTPTERLTWDNAIPYFPRTNSVGQPYSLSAYNCFMTANLNLLMVDLAAINSWVTPTEDVLITDIGGSQIDASANQITMVFYPSPMSTQYRYLVYCSGPYSTQTAAKKNNFIRISDWYPPSDTPATLGTSWRFIRGAFIAGKWYWIKVIPVNVDCGLAYVPIVNIVPCVP